MQKREELMASLQAIIHSMREDLSGFDESYQHKYKRLSKYDVYLQLQITYIKLFCERYLQLINLTKELEQFPKLKINKHNFELIEAHAGHLYQQLKEHYLPFLEGELSSPRHDQAKSEEDQLRSDITDSFIRLSAEYQSIGKTYNAAVTKKTLRRARRKFGGIARQRMARAVVMMGLSLVLVIGAACGSENNNVTDSTTGDTAVEIRREPIEQKMRKVDACLLVGNSHNQYIRNKWPWDNDDVVINKGDGSWKRNIAAKVRSGRYKILVITGHHRSGFKTIYGDGGEKFSLEELPASEHIEAVFFSACTTAGNGILTSRGIYKPLIRKFPNLKMIVGFKHTSLAEDGVIIGALSIRKHLKKTNGLLKFAHGVIGLNQNRVGVAMRNDNGTWIFVDANMLSGTPIPSLR